MASLSIRSIGPSGTSSYSISEFPTTNEDELTSQPVYEVSTLLGDSPTPSMDTHLPLPPSSKRDPHLTSPKMDHHPPPPTSAGREAIPTAPLMGIDLPYPRATGSESLPTPCKEIPVPSPPASREEDGERASSQSALFERLQALEEERAALLLQLARPTPNTISPCVKAARTPRTPSLRAQLPPTSPPLEAGRHPTPPLLDKELPSTSPALAAKFLPLWKAKLHPTSHFFKAVATARRAGERFTSV